MSSPSSDLISTEHSHDQLIELISPWVVPLGYQVIYIELQTHRQKVLRIYIDHIDDSCEQSIGIEDCVRVSRVIDERIDQSPEAEKLLPSAYELEVSSPGLDRPLRTSGDFQRFAGREVRIHVFRPMTREELGNSLYQERNPKQKNFLGTLVGFDGGKVVLSISKEAKGSGKKSKAKKNATLTTNSVEGDKITIPLPLISKANLEPKFDFEGSDERE